MKTKVTVKTRGFTLVELAIVLVVIGLLMAMVFKGRSIIDGARTKVDLDRIEKITSAVHSYYSKYNILPGEQPDKTFVVKEMYDMFLKEDLLKTIDFKIDSKDSVGGDSYWAFVSCKSMTDSATGAKYWELLGNQLEGELCIFRSMTNPESFTTVPDTKSSTSTGISVCQIESAMDDKNLKGGDGRIAFDTGSTPSDFGATDVDKDWNCSSKTTNMGKNLSYAIKVF